MKTFPSECGLVNAQWKQERVFSKYVGLVIRVASDIDGHRGRDVVEQTPGAVDFPLPHLSRYQCAG